MECKAISTAFNFLGCANWNITRMECKVDFDTFEESLECTLEYNQNGM